MSLNPNRRHIRTHTARLAAAFSLLALTALPAFAQDGEAIAPPETPESAEIVVEIPADAVDATALDAAEIEASIINPDAPVIYIVQPGDTLNKIARAFSMTWNQLATLNNIANPNLIYVGQVLYIQKGTGQNPGNPGNPGPISGDYYVVQSGDTLAKIAARANTTVTELVKLNKLADANRIYTGQRLLVRGFYVDPIPATYTVQSGDTLYKISVRFATTVDALARLNNLTNINRIYVGQVLKIS